ncbi:related to enoyl-CoA hydratase/isomerase family protein [Ramularia collo-cygni]|uniref:Related to enoyl-CoA hydratase/isomerase family protein n=1 Tax=Ramularia collo-cygni TaxID=112498 RepID=A0A2D3VQC2_9PEZI|nr:related to enoyl-CoA hydratase/isomerase family protein [Ramularia collo-cygni]CZT25464.1 related to enoyl-CoA hydratase/isomerase family protein [Ramularia collo-cygni]
MTDTQAGKYKFPELLITFPAPFVVHVEINRPKKYNSFSPDVFHGLAKLFDQLSQDEDVRCIMISGSGPHFSAGLDVQAANSSGPVSQPRESDDIARKAWRVRRHALDYQNGITAIERCEKPVICLAHGVTYGAAIDLAVAADVRYCTKNARWSVKEVDVGLAADVGTLTRLPKIGVSYSWAKEVVYTAREFGGEEALKVGLVSQITETKEQLIEEGLKLAVLIASKSPVAVQSSKALLDFSRDRPIDDGLKYTAAWNAAMVLSDDVKVAMMSGIKKTKPKFEKL